MKTILSSVALVVVLKAVTCTAGEIDYLEDFALATDRTVPLKQLIPGTEDYYYYHCLHYQNTEQFDKVEQELQAWIARHKTTPRVREIQNRQALLTYHQNPPRSLEFIQKQLGIHFNHQRETMGQERRLPTQLDPNAISRDRLRQTALRRHQNLDGFEDHALEWLIRETLNPERRRDLLRRLQRPDYPHLPRLVVDDLNYKNSRGFGSMNIHRQLLLRQLDECLKLKSDLLNQGQFVNTYLAKLFPRADVDWRHDAERHEAYLSRLWAFTQRLAPVHNSLKAHVLYHWLLLDRSRGVYDKQRFLTYIRLPRNVPYISRRYMQLDDNRRNPANLGQDFRGVTLLPVVGDDQPLVRSYLHHFFQIETTYKPYEPYIDDTYLKHNFAEAKIVNGLGEAEQWVSMLPPADYQQLKERIDLDFAFTNNVVFAADESVGLDLDIKNVSSLIVKVFEINTENYYRQYGREVNTDVNLDGLVANEEATFEYSEAPVRRVRRHFDFKALTKPGVYVVDFIGNGKSSRAVVRKGKLHYVARTSTAGHVLTVMDDQDQKLPQASVWIAGHQYDADEDGLITIPFSTSPRRQAIVLSDGDFSSLQSIQHQAERYSLSAGIYVDRESLLSQRKAQAVVRPGLLLNGTPVTLSVLEDIRLTLASVDQDGVSTTKEIGDFKLYEDRESVYEFQVPPRTAQVTITLTAKVQNMSWNKKMDLAVGETFTLNEIDKTDKVEDLHLTKIDGHYRVDVLGKTGEGRPDRPIQFSLKHRDFKEPVLVSLQSDGHGHVALGLLHRIVSVTATGPEGTSHTWSLERDRRTYPQAIHGVAGSITEVPTMGMGQEPDRSRLSLLELRGNTFVADRFDALSVQDDMLRVEGLPPGDYDLLLKETGIRLPLRLARGPKRDGYVLGETRRLEVRAEKPLQIQRIETDENQLTVRLNHATKFTRVHVFASYYHPAHEAFAYLSRVRDAEPYLEEVRKLESLYVEGRDIGDEYRYIIDRKRAQRFPGNMLDRPSLLLNPWAIRDTLTGQQAATAGDQFGARAEPKGPPRRGPPQDAEAASVDGGFANLDFLYETAALLLNLVPDDQGVVAIPRKDLGTHPQVHIVAIDPRTTVYRSVSLPEPKREVLDLRLAGGLDPETHFTQRKQISVIHTGDTFQLPDVASSRFEVYDSLSRIHTLYATLSGDPKLAEFRFILDWPGMSEEEKRAKYSKYACHELNFFLFKKDPDFFARVVRPYVTNKKDKTFLDRWLVQDDLQEYLLPWSHAQLNIVERILLAQHIAGQQEPTGRHVEDLLHLIPPDAGRFDHLFQTALMGSSLEVEGRLGGFGGGAFGGVRGALGARRLLRADGLGRAPQERDAAGRPSASAARQQERLAELADDADVTLEAGMAGAVTESLKSSLKRKNAPALAAQARGTAVAKDKAFFSRDADRRGRARQLYRRLDTTEEWVENNYYHVPIEQQNADLVTVNAFWNDYARHQPTEPFHSEHFAEASRNFPEIMFALSVLDIPFEAKDHKTEFDKPKMTLQAGSPLVIFHEQTEPTTDAASETPILVSQNFFRHDDRYRHVNNQRQDKFVMDEFLIHTVYGCQVVVTNPTSSPQQLDLLLQLPVGAMPVQNARYTRNVNMNLEPFHTQTVEYLFYFPRPGQYRHYPVQVAKNEQLLASAEPVTLNVVQQLSQIDRQSWDYVSQHAANDQVLQFLQQNNLYRINLDKIAFRMTDSQFFATVTDLLAERHVYNNTLWSYGIKHNVVPAIGQYLQHADAFVNQCGTYIDSPLVTIDPVIRKTYQHMDYRPLVNARAHPLGARRQILNDRFHAQYHRLLKVLSYRRDLDDDDLMSVVGYMLLQDRVDEGLRFYSRVDPERLATRLQHDYFGVYLDFYTADTAHARAVADRYADYPVDRWRKAFASVRSQLDEIQAKDVTVVDPENRTQSQTKLAATAPSFEFTVEGQQVRIDYQNLARVRVNYYLMDIELLFSRNPFVQNHAGQFSHIRPNDSQVVQLPRQQSSLFFELPEPLRNQNVLVEIRGGGQAKTHSYYSNSMSVQTIENYGQVRVTSKQQGRPIAKVYVKAYAQMKDGSVRFYKDGYTDLRGRFDYTSLSTNELDFVQKLSLLVYSDQHGAVVREVNPPKQ